MCWRPLPVVNTWWYWLPWLVGTQKMFSMSMSRRPVWSQTIYRNFRNRRSEAMCLMLGFYFERYYSVSNGVYRAEDLMPHSGLVWRFSPSFEFLLILITTMKLQPFIFSLLSYHTVIVSLTFNCLAVSQICNWVGLYFLMAAYVFGFRISSWWATPVRQGFSHIWPFY